MRYHNTYAGSLDCGYIYFCMCSFACFEFYTMSIYCVVFKETILISEKVI
jgi:hypothetical protein